MTSGSLGASSRSPSDPLGGGGALVLTPGRIGGSPPTATLAQTLTQDLEYWNLHVAGRVFLLDTEIDSSQQLYSLCDAKVGDEVLVIGPFGSTFLMPNHPGSNLLMICTGTGSAPMRAMTEFRRRLQRKVSPGRLMLFFGARTQQELPYFGPLMKLPKDFIDINLAFSRTPGAPKRYVQDLLRERAADVAALLADANTSVFVCGLKSMEEGVAAAPTCASCSPPPPPPRTRWPCAS